MVATRLDFPGRRGLGRAKERFFLVFVSLVLNGLHLVTATSVFGGDFTGSVLLLITIVVRTIYFRYVSVFRDVASLAVWFYIELSMVLWPGMVVLLTGSVELRDEAGMAFAYRLGELCLIIHACVSLIARTRPINSRRIKCRRIPWLGITNKKLLSWWIVFIAGSFIVTGLALVLGIATLGKEKITHLPFKLTGFINYTHLYVVPFVYIIFLDIFYNRSERLRVKWWFFWFTVWLVFESTMRMSKGQLFLGYLPILFWSMYAGLFKYRWLKWGVVVILVVILVFPTVALYRNYHNAGIDTPITHVVKQQIELFNSDAQLISAVGLSAYERIFAAGRHILKFKPYIENPYRGGNFAEVVAMGGTAQYHTHVVDKFPEEMVHSSGATGISDAFMMGGVPLAFGTMLLISMVSVFVVDGERPRWYRWTMGAKAMGALFMLQLMMGGVWIWLFKGVFANFVLPLLFLWQGWLAKRADKSEKNKSLCINDSETPPLSG